MCLIILGWLWLPTVAQPTPADWRAWLHDQHGHLVLIDHSGRKIDEVWLLLPEDSQVVGPPTFSRDGRRVTFAAYQSGTRRQQRFVLDTSDGTLLDLPVPNERSLNPNDQAAFDESGRLLAYRAADGAVLVVDTVSGEIRQRLDASTANLPTTLQSARPFTPIVQRFADQSVWFSIDADGLSLHPISYRWNLITGNVTETYAYAEHPSDTFALTGEVASIAPVANSIVIYEPLTRASFPIFHNPALEIVNNGVWFVENGQHLLMHARSSRAEQADVWLLLARDGTLVRPLRDVDRRTIHGTADGFVYMLAHDGISEFIHTATGRPFSDRSLWQAEGIWDIVWVDPGADFYGPYMPWTVNGERRYDPVETTGITAPTPLPTGLPLLAPNMDVFVNTNGDVLYLRDAPGLDSTILQYLYDRDVVTLLEGPVAQDGFRWWRVRTEDGAEGWAAEVSDDVSTLLPERPPRVRSTPTPVHD